MTDELKPAELERRPTDPEAQGRPRDGTSRHDEEPRPGSGRTEGRDVPPVDRGLGSPWMGGG